MTGQRSIVAIVDDDPSMLNALRHLLDASGFLVETFESAEGFVQREPFTNVSCLILDVNLGGMSGFDLSRHLSESGYRLPIIFISALHDQLIATEARDHGCAAFLKKPFTSERLVDAIKRAIGTAS